jgi:Thioredoxin like C-terminal domain
VLTSDSGEPYRVRVTMDGQYLTEENKGQDVMIGEGGESFILGTEPRLYAIVDNPEYVQHKVLQLSSNSNDFGLFAFTFGVYQEGP